MSQRSAKEVAEILELAPLLARIEEARAVGGLSPLDLDEELAGVDLLKEICLRLADDLESNGRRLIQTSVQLLGLREVAASAVTLSDPERITSHIASYLKKAFGFEDVFLLAVDNREGALRGTWLPSAGPAEGVPLRIPLNQHASLVVSVFFSDTPSLVDDAGAIPLLAEIGPPFEEPAGTIGSYALVPLVGGRAPSGPWAGAEDSPGANRGPHTVIVGPERMPAVGVLGIAASRDSTPLDGCDLSHLESIAPSVGAALETALLHMDLRRNERFTSSVLESMNSGLVAVGLDGRIMIFNRMAEKLTRWSAENAVGKNLEEVLPEKGRRSHVLETLETGNEFVRAETTVELRDGGQLPISLATFLIIGADSNLIGAVGTFVDLTALKMMEEKVRRLDRLATLGKFTSAVAHEIRNPLTGIAAGAQYISKGMPPDDPQQQNIKFVMDEIMRLNRIISDLFNITHPHQPLLHPQRIEPILVQTIKTVEEEAKAREVTIETNIGKRLPLVAIDADQMEQVLINLIKNGIDAAGQNGRVRVSVSETKAALGHGEKRQVPCLEVAVWDSGAGIKKEDRARIFEPFFSTKDGGTGLGLYISSGIVERHGGTISVGTGRGGTTLSVRLPLNPKDKEDPRK
jgi:PAS domain S-box-containing protein